MNDSDALRMAVLTALIGQHGPLPCLHVARVRMFTPFAPGAGPNALGGGQEFQVRYCVEASELRVEGDAVVLGLSSLDAPTHFAEALRFSKRSDAAEKRDKLCVAYLRLPWDRTPLGRPLTPDDAAMALRHVQASSDGMKIFPGSTEEISAWTFGNHTESTPGASD